MADYQLIERHAKLPQPAFRFDQDQFRYASFSGILNKCKDAYHSLFLYRSCDMIDFDTYIRIGEPGGKERAEAWKAAIGLQDVDGLKTSEY